MNFEKLKPWNWFKHEDDSTKQIPVSKIEPSGSMPSRHGGLYVPHNQAMGSLMSLHQEMNHMFDEVCNSFGMPSNSLFNRSNELGRRFLDRAVLGDYRAKLDVAGSEHQYEVSIDLPGMSEDDIQIELNDNTLTVTGHKEEVNENKDKQYYCVERSVGRFQRTLSLPEDADSAAISAKIKNGLLEIQIPRKALLKADVKRIPISS